MLPHISLDFFSRSIRIINSILIAALIPICTYTSNESSCIHAEHKIDFVFFCLIDSIPDSGTHTRNILIRGNIKYAILKSTHEYTFSTVVIDQFLNLTIRYIGKRINCRLNQISTFKICISSFFILLRIMMDHSSIKKFHSLVQLRMLEFMLRVIQSITQFGF